MSGPEESPERPTRDSPLVLGEDIPSGDSAITYWKTTAEHGPLLVIRNTRKTAGISLRPDEVSSLRDYLNREARRGR